MEKNHTERRITQKKKKIARLIKKIWNSPVAFCFDRIANLWFWLWWWFHPVLLMEAISWWEENDVRQCTFQKEIDFLAFVACDCSFLAELNHWKNSFSPNMAIHFYLRVRPLGGSTCLSWSHRKILLKAFSDPFHRRYFLWRGLSTAPTQHHWGCWMLIWTANTKPEEGSSSSNLLDTIIILIKIRQLVYHLFVMIR